MILNGLIQVLTRIQVQTKSARKKDVVWGAPGSFEKQISQILAHQPGGHQSWRPSLVMSGHVLSMDWLKGKIELEIPILSIFIHMSW